MSNMHLTLNTSKMEDSIYLASHAYQFFPQPYRSQQMTPTPILLLKQKPRLFCFFLPFSILLWHWIDYKILSLLPAQIYLKLLAFSPSPSAMLLVKVNALIIQNERWTGDRQEGQQRDHLEDIAINQATDVGYLRPGQYQQRWWVVQLWIYFKVEPTGLLMYDDLLMSSWKVDKILSTWARPF